MTAELDLGFGVLGPLEVHASGKSLAIGGAKRRTVLAALLLNANRLVTTDRLIEAVWPDAPPRSAVSNLQTYVSALRRCLPGGEARIRRGPAGYTISVAPGELDCRTFEELAGEAARMKAHGRPAEALELLGRALALWRGHPLEDLSAGGSVFDAEVVRLVESRLAAGEERVELLVAVGKYTEAVAEIRDLLERHPFRERSWQRSLSGEVCGCRPGSRRC
jgi:DNA-binding SARP family transcriptional activator